MKDINNVSKIRKKQKKGFTTNEKGQSRFDKGNQFGRMPKKGFTLNDLNKLVREYDKTQDISLLEHYVEQLRKDNKLLNKYVDKNIPTKNINELTGPDGEPIHITLHKIIYGKGGKEAILEDKGKTGNAKSG